MPSSVIEFYWVGSNNNLDPQIIINAGPSFFILVLILTRTNYTMKYGFSSSAAYVTTGYTGGITWTSGDRIRIVKLTNNVYIQLYRPSTSTWYNIGGFNNETLNFSGYGTHIAFQFTAPGGTVPVMTQLTEYSIPLWDQIVASSSSSRFTASLIAGGTQVVTNTTVTTASNVILTRVSGGSGSPAYVVSVAAGSFTIGNTAADTAIYNYVVLN
jgi:hypothetical protein